MIFRCVLTISLALSFESSAQNLVDIQWKDKPLAECVMQSAQKQVWTQVTHVTALKCHKAGIQDAQILNQFTALQSLSLYNNKIVSIDLTSLTDLRTLNIASNKLRDLKITELSNLESLFLFKNKLTTLDLTGLISVKKVRLMQNNLTHLDITPMLALETGYFFDNQLEDLQITGLEKLTFLDVKQNPMPDELYDFYDKQEGIVISHDGNADDWQ
jgi:protein phosphatase 1 regulatory subunit 7